jgi:GcrA cell cycle regulator
MAHDTVDRQALRAGPARFDWSKARIALLRRRWAEGLSASTIARELGPGVSRSAVLGKAYRFKLKQPEFKRHHWRKEEAHSRPPAPRPAVSRRAGGRGPSKLKAAFQALGLDAFFGEPDTRTVHRHAGQAFGPTCGLLDLSSATCRWPVGEPDEPDFAFCGAVPLRRYPYCVAHCLIAYRPASRDDDTQPAAEPARRLGRAA